MQGSQTSCRFVFHSLLEEICFFNNIISIMLCELSLQPQKGKAPTKGAKQILSENAATITFYRNMALGSTLFYGILMAILYPDEVTVWIIVSLS